MSTARHSKSAGPTAAGVLPVSVAERESERDLGAAKNGPSQTQTLLSRLQLARSLPSALHATLLHSLSWPSSGSTASHWASDEPGAPPPPRPGPSSRPASDVWHQMPTVESNEAVVRVAPVGEKARERTVRECEVGMVDERWKLEGPAAEGEGEGEYE